jgi:hypothetical protein
MNEALILGLQEYLERQLGSSELAQFYTDALWQLALPWKESAPSPRKANLIMAFAFGQRRDLNGNALPDPIVSPRLKRLLHETASTLKCNRGYVQWEIAEANGPPIPAEMKVIRPRLNPEDATPTYLSTEDICTAAAEDVVDPKSLTVCVLSHRHHAWRCVRAVRSFGFQAWAPYEDLPDQYDGASSQPWCRSGEQYIIHDLISRLRWFRPGRQGGP